VTVFEVILLVLMTRALACAGQIFFKKAMSRPDDEARGKGAFFLACGIVIMALTFFLWQGLLEKHDLSYLYPFEGVDHVLLVLGASYFLKERATPRLWAGVALIVAGVVLVSTN
jgi:uncharacterized membrane protein